MQDALGRVQSVVIFGATSEIAQATIDRLAEGGRLESVVLASRRPEDLGPTVARLEGRGVRRVETVAFDATDTRGHEALVDEVFQRAGEVDVVLLTFGVLGDQEHAERDGAAATEIATINYVGAMSLGVAVSNRLRAQGHGAIVVLSSVAGERARRSNFVYGSSKAGLDAFFQGLTDSLAGSGVNVLVVRPGFVRTKMTAGLADAPLATTPQAVAAAIAAGLTRGSTTIWVPSTLRYVMSALRHVPRPIFRRLPI